MEPYPALNVERLAARHPNALTAPPVVRGSMPPTPWRGFWRGLLGARMPARPEAREPWQRAATRRRGVFIAGVLLSTALAATLFAQVQPAHAPAWLTTPHLLLFTLLSAWVTSGFVTALMGAWVLLRGDPHALDARAVRAHTLAPDVRTAIAMTICNEDVNTVFAGLRATCESLQATGHAHQFDVYVLSDSSHPDTIAAERAAWESLRAALAEDRSGVEVYYRLRRRRTHRKAGNVADFCRRWGRLFRYLVVLDADSVMSGDCLLTLAKLMEAHPRAGIIQTETQAVGQVTLHARAHQFAARVTGRLFALGMRFWQLGESHYWGHNAIIRVEPFMRHCALAPLPGRGGLSGGILSHDFVEAALMRRAGYHVWLVDGLGGSYEQQPPDLLSELQRDRRWCQGNLQNARLIAEPGLHPVHRGMLLTGAMAYLSAPLWLAFMSLGALLWLGLAGDTRELPGLLLGLWGWTLLMLFLPRALGVVAVLVRGEAARFGGVLNLSRSAVLEATLATAQSPLRMLAHTVFVLAALTGWRLEWKSPPREALAVPWPEAWRRLAPVSGLAVLMGCVLLAVEPWALPWLSPVLLPLLLVVPLAVWTSQPGNGAAWRARRWLLIPEEAGSPAVLRRAWGLAALPAWRISAAA